jgi:thioredoxin 1
MAIVNATDTTFADVITREGTYLIDFWATWCGPCRQFAPIFEESSEKHTDITYVKVDTDANQNLSQYFQISSIPTLVAIRDGVVLHSQAGALPGPVLEDLITQLKAVDMESVKAEIATEETAVDSAAEAGTE